MSVQTWKKAVIAAAAGAALVAGAGVALSERGDAASSSVKPVPAPATGASLPTSFSHIIEQVGPAVVSIRVTGKAPGRMSNIPDEMIPDFFKRFFGDQFGRDFGFEFRQNERGEGPPRRAPRMQGMGSGFFVDPEGHVVTNNHVVAEAEEIEVVLKDGSTKQATLVGRDPKTDLALLKVEGNEAFPFAKFGDSSAAKVGDWVIAVGSPFGLGHTATTGIVSARGREIGSGPYDDFLQIDASINKGNSGGPAFNMKGEVIGVNTAILSPTGTNAGIGFAIPSNMARKVIDQLKEHGTVSRGWLGVQVQEVTPDIAESLGLDEAHGAIVASVLEDGPAKQAGIEEGDVILSVNGEKIEKMRELPRLVASLKAGERTTVTILRDDSRRDVNVRIGKMEETETSATTGPESGSSQQRFGMTLAPVDDAMRDRLGLDAGITGAVVTDLDPGGIAAEKGLRPGDVIVRISGQKVEGPGDVLRRLDEASRGERKAVLMLVHRGGNNRYVALPLGKA